MWVCIEIYSVTCMCIPLVPLANKEPGWSSLMFLTVIDVQVSIMYVQEKFCF